jgi:hypothetical protein
MLNNYIKLRRTFRKESNFKKNKPTFFFLEEALFFPKFFSRIVGVVFNVNKTIINNWNFNNTLSEWSLSKILSFSFFNYDFFINKYFLFLANIFKKKNKIFLKNNDIVLFGPWPNIYFHQLVDFILRINFIKYKKYNRIFLPLFLKKILSSSPYKSIFSKQNFHYYNYDNKIIFYNLRYISGLNHYNKNSTLKKTILNLKNSIKNKFLLNSKKYKYSIISRNRSSRNLHNENILFQRLKKYGFRRFYFEELSYLEQIKICYNSQIVIGYQGSGLANVIFMKKNSNLIQVCNIYINNPVIKLLCDINNINNYNINCYINNKNLSGLVNVDLVENKVKDIIKKN